VRPVLLLIALLSVCLPVSANSLCELEDEVVFACEIGSKNVSVCMTEKGRIEYVYGAGDTVELELNSPLFSSAACPGGGISRLRFKNGNYSYIVYDVMCHSGGIGENQRSKSDFSGLVVLNQSDVVFNKTCTSFENEVFGVNSGILPESVEKEDFDYNIP